MKRYISMLKRMFFVMVCAVMFTFSMWQTPSVYTASTPTDQDASTDAVLGLVRRVLPDFADLFVFVQIPADNGRDVFEIETLNDKVVIRGNNGVSMAMGMNWYLKHHCRSHISMQGNQLRLPDLLSNVKSKIRQVSWARHRYFLNYCAFGYSLVWWDWPKWEKLIDWMALNGINTPLSVTGQEAIWQAVCRQLELDDKQIEDFLAGPPYLPFGWMGCLDGWGGPLPQSWIDKHEDLQKRILARQRELGMTPVLQGFTGHVPPAIAEKFPKAKLHTVEWIEWRTHMLDSQDPLFAKIAKIYMEEQIARFGTDHLYAADPFIEMTPPSGETEFLQNMSRALLKGMTATDPKAVWVLQGWPFHYKGSFWKQPRIKAFLDAVPNQHMIMLDLFCENTPVWEKTQAFYGKPWVWCNIQNFGNTVFLGGNLDLIARESHAARVSADSGSMVGMGFVNEGLGFNPVVFDLMFEMAWTDGPMDVKTYLRDYARARYGRSDADVDAAWEIMHATIYAASGSNKSSICITPRLHGNVPLPSYQDSLTGAWEHLLKAGDAFGGLDTYRYDLVNIARQVLSNHSALLHNEVIKAHTVGDYEGFVAAAERFLELIDDLDELLATRKEFLLGVWLEDAKRWGTTDSERAIFEWNARRIITLWGSGNAIRDYANKEWSGMLSGFYRKRWAIYFQAVGEAMKTGKPLDAQTFRTRLLKWEDDWSNGRETYSIVPRGDSVAVARKLWKKHLKKRRQGK